MSVYPNWLEGVASGEAGEVIYLDRYIANNNIRFVMKELICDFNLLNGNYIFDQAINSIDIESVNPIILESFQSGYTFVADKVCGDM